MHLANHTKIFPQLYVSDVVALQIKEGELFMAFLFTNVQGFSAHITEETLSQGKLVSYSKHHVEVRFRAFLGF